MIEAMKTTVLNIWVIFLVLAALKIAGQLDWPWWAVAAPLWGGSVLFVVVTAVLVAVGVVKDEMGRDKKR